jgi:hypothetical protein
MNIRKFDGTNFNFWKEQMHDYLVVRGYIDPIEHDTAVESGHLLAVFTLSIIGWAILVICKNV